MNEEIWDRSKQTYYILRRNNPWSVYNMDDKYICDFPAYCYKQDLTKQICFAQTDDEVKSIIENNKND